MSKQSGHGLAGVRPQSMHGHTKTRVGQGKHMQTCRHRSGTTILDKHALKAGGWRMLCGG